MPSRRSTGGVGRAADLLLSTLIVFAPLAAGSWKLEVLPALLLLATLAWFTTYLGIHQRRRDLHLGVLPGVLLGLAGLTLLQALPLPAALLSSLSPEAHRLRSFVQGDGSGPLSYEPGATLREATKLVIYALVAQTTLERTRGRGLRERVAIPIVISGLLAAGVAILHRVLGIERLFGLLSPITAGRQMLTTFVNPNHAAGFMVLVTLAAVGLALRSRDSIRKVAFGSCALLSAGLCVYTGSKGGIGALLLALLLFAGLRAARGWRSPRTRPRFGSALVSAVLLAPVLLLTWNINAVAAWLEPADGTPSALGLAEKAAALQDALPMIFEHAFTGIGRGAYVSVYTRYQTSDLQLTFAYPENIAAQLTSEWGLVLGLAALFALGIALVNRLWLCQRPIALALMCGVAGVMAQNIFDFSLELPGVALPAVAVLGGVSGEWSSALRISSRKPTTWLVVGLVPVVGALLCVGAFVQGDLPRDLDALQARIEALRAGEPAETEPSEATLLLRHPASALMAAQAAHIAELQTPPRLEDAVRWANRTLLLAPTYAGGHLVTGRLLIRGGHRNQGFEELRRAWALSGADNRSTYVRHVADLARTTDELARAVPRRDPALGVMSERGLSELVRQLVQLDRRTEAQRLLEAHADVASTPPEDLRILTVAADEAGATDLALQAAQRLLAEQPGDAGIRLLAARIAFRHGRIERARSLLAGVDRRATDPEALLELRFKLEVSDGDMLAAEATLHDLEAVAHPGAKREVELALLAVQLYSKAQRPDRALETLDKAIARRPGELALRLSRARLLLGTGRPARALSDLEYLLSRRPNDPEARALLDRAKKGLTEFQPK